MPYYLSITIGRNIGDQPMTEQDWQRFKNDTKAAIYRNTGGIANVVFEGEGEGIWDGDSKQTFTYAAIVSFDLENVRGGIVALNIDGLNNALARLASKYQQDTIARALVPLLNGDETLVYARLNRTKRRA